MEVFTTHIPIKLHRYIIDPFDDLPALTEKYLKEKGNLVGIKMYILLLIGILPFEEFIIKIAILSTMLPDMYDIG